jgi:hypothetical protein
VRRYEGATGESAVLVETGETFEALAAAGRGSKAPVSDLNPISLPGFDVERSGRPNFGY